MAAVSDLHPVLVVGAGPTGLAAAMSLARAHIPVRLIDRAPEPARHSRAIGIQARTLELFEQHRVVEPFLELGHRARVANLYSNGQRRARLDFDPLQTRYPYLLFLDQTVTERILATHLESFGVKVERGVELVEFSQGSAGVHATLRRADGHTETLRPSYLVAADGAHSTIRHRLGMSFMGKAFEQTFLLADVNAETEWPDDEFHLFASGEGLAGLFPLGKGWYRLIADHTPAAMPAGESEHAEVHVSTAASPAAPSLDECRDVVERRVHHVVRLSELSWSSYFHINSRMVEQLRVDRVFLAGDAAHVHSPAGAQGMNTGIQEAFNVGWKIARVLAHGAPDRLLDTYHMERHPIERDVLRQTSFVTQLVGAEHGPLKLLRERVMPLLAAFGPLRDAARATVSELAIQYRRSPLTLERVLDGGPRAGERAPDALVHVIDGPLGKAPGKGCIFDLHDPGCFSLFVLEEREAEAMDVAADAAHAPLAIDERVTLAATANGDGNKDDLARLVSAVESLLGEAVRVWRVTDTEGEGAAPLVEAYGRTRPAFYLVRPDGYIAARGRPASDLNALLRHCEAWFVRGADDAGAAAQG
ncbi:FAD-dependent monooxygenase [Paraburkholderia kururiensis]|uniref:FAD-dependent monooxygenase n=1 Tax=Paraburkholderia kururiensis TaxID=984307 RepID=A0ABZ0WTQ6_9BURK|nr:FAD-dependent monooxygenase [Paraburkholderia kururiensis]WQD80792.1 FAD-dependent monooxygenase [Paraburkholderia kururiensis]